MQVGNDVTGDMAGRDIIKTVIPALTGMGRLINEFGAESGQREKLTKLIGQLEHYYDSRANEDVRGLEEKLSAADRKDLLSSARKSKQYASQFVMKHQSSLAAQKIISHLLAKLLSDFNHVVVPLIQSGASRPAVDSAIKSVMDDGWAFLESNPLEIDHRLLEGFLYFLGGNCHLRWDPC